MFWNMVSFEPMLFWVCSRSRFLASADNSFYRLTILSLISWNFLQKGWLLSPSAYLRMGMLCQSPPQKKNNDDCQSKVERVTVVLAFLPGLDQYHGKKNWWILTLNKNIGFCEMDVMDVDVCIYIYIHSYGNVWYVLMYIITVPCLLFFFWTQPVC